MKKKKLIGILLILVIISGSVAIALNSSINEKDDTLYFADDPALEIKEEDNTRVILTNEPFIEIPKEEKWWETASDKEVIKTLYNSLVFEDKVTHKLYKGIDDLKFAYNDDFYGYGGLKLIENPYNIWFSYEFQETPRCATNDNVINALWNCPDGLCQFNLPTFTIEIPEVESHETVLKKLGLKELYGNTKYGTVVIGYEEVQ